MNGHPLATGLAGAVADRALPRLATYLAEDVHLRALLPADVLEEDGREAVLARFDAWFRTYETVQLAQVTGDDVGDRVLVHYKLLFDPDGDRRVLTQTIVCGLRDGLVRRMDLVLLRIPGGLMTETHSPTAARPGLDLLDWLGRWGAHDRDRPFPLYAAVRDAGPVHDVTLTDGHRAFLVIGHAAAREALNHPDLSKDMQAALAGEGAVVAEGLPGPAFSRHMLNVDAPDHTRLRGLAAAAFTRRRVEALEPRMHEIATDLLDALAAQGDRAVDLVEGYAGPFPFAVLGELLGIDREDQHQLAVWFTTLLAPYSGSEPPAATVEASDRVVGYLNDLVDRRWADPTDDLVGDLVRACQGDELTREELLSTLFQLVVAGHDTTTSLIGNGVVALLTHLDQRDALAADLSLVPTGVEEFLRWDAPAPHATFRYATRDVTIAGTRIPAGVQVLVALAAPGRDPERHEDPERFDVTRRGASHLAFGHGIHHCLGARLARLEGKIAFTELLARFPRLELAVPADELRWGRGDGLVLRGLSALPVRLDGGAS